MTCAVMKRLRKVSSPSSTEGRARHEQTCSSNEQPTSTKTRAAATASRRAPAIVGL